ncbi:protease m50 membrane-bound transcription factor site 2 protease [Anaeramoeba flamelloides]|uniref:Endopeptidase S2P n=1 Tax=Anaeramoeba flamelloides TaxID=1746091 RepID=A0ABQ8XAS1_9EUKA|nr:protease m50 membrane-bound transcription factor site 2 protease [Anaeramoeba flamelloides]
MIGFTLYLIFWVGGYVLLRILFTFFSKQVESILDISRLSISIFSVTRYSPTMCSYVNRFLKLPKRVKSFFNGWFSIGVVVSLGLIVSVFIFLAISTIIGIKAIIEKNTNVALLKWIYLVYIPGSHAPLSYLFLHLFLILLVSFLHELGHVLAAVSLDLPISKVGYYLAVFWPGFFVEINSVIHRIPFHDKMKICCAGIWHTFVIAMLILFLLIIGPYMTPLFYENSNGAVITSIKSPHFQKMLSVGDSIVKINDCKINKTKDVYKCLEKNLQNFLNKNCKNIQEEDNVNVNANANIQRHLNSQIENSYEKKLDLDMATKSNTAGNSDRNKNRNRNIEKETNNEDGNEDFQKKIQNTKKLQKSNENDEIINDKDKGKETIKIEKNQNQYDISKKLKDIQCKSIINKKYSITITLDTGKQLKVSGNSEVFSKVIYFGNLIPKWDFARKFQIFYKLPKTLFFVFSFAFSTMINVLVITAAPGIVSECETILKLIVEKNTTEDSQLAALITRILKTCGSGLLFCKFLLTLYFSAIENKLY